MGCDIHMVGEVRKNGVWEPAQEFYKESDGAGPYIKVKELYTGRNYRLFSILANVRNGFGFAGVPTGEGFRPISMPRGIPKDCHKQTREYLESYGNDGHSHSHNTVQQLLDYDWTQVSKLQGVLSAGEFWDWDRYSRGQGEGPASWSDGVGGASVRMVEESEMRKLVDATISGCNTHEKNLSALDRELPSVYTSCTWELPYYKCVDRFLSETMPRLWHLGRPEDVRILFFFDN